VKRLILLSLFSLFAIACNAQSFFDGFESYKVDSADYLYPKGPWTIDATFWPYPHPVPMVRSTTRGVVPFEGNKMLEIRSVANTDLAPIFAPNDGLRQLPALQYSMRLRVASADFVGQYAGVDMRLTEGSRSIISFDFQQQRITTVGFGGSIWQNADIRLDTWIDLSARIDFQAKQVTFRVNDLAPIVRQIDPLDNSARVSDFAIGARASKDVTDRYPLAQGAPGVFLDNFRSVVVPEPGSVWTLVFGFAMVVAIHKRRE
jgi:hypothetical protein